jgi:hypothetical protein
MWICRRSSADQFWKLPAERGGCYFRLRDKVRALASAAFHLKKDGIFAFDVLFPKFEKIPGGIGQEILELEWRDSADARRVIRRYFQKDSVDKINQIFTAAFFFRTYLGDNPQGRNRALNHVLLHLPTSARPVPAGRPRAL